MDNTHEVKESEEDSLNTSTNSFRIELKLDTRVILKALAIAATIIGVGLVL